MWWPFGQVTRSRVPTEQLEYEAARGVPISEPVVTTEGSLPETAAQRRARLGAVLTDPSNPIGAILQVAAGFGEYPNRLVGQTITPPSQRPPDIFRAPKATDIGLDAVATMDPNSLESFLVRAAANPTMAVLGNLIPGEAQAQQEVLAAVGATAGELLLDPTNVLGGEAAIGKLGTEAAQRVAMAEAQAAALRNLERAAAREAVDAIPVPQVGTVRNVEVPGTPEFAAARAAEQTLRQQYPDFSDLIPGYAESIGERAARRVRGAVARDEQAAQAAAGAAARNPVPLDVTGAQNQFEIARAQATARPPVPRAPVAPDVPDAPQVVEPQVQPEAPPATTPEPEPPAQPPPQDVPFEFGGRQYTARQTEKGIEVYRPDGTLVKKPARSTAGMAELALEKARNPQNWGVEAQAPEASVAAPAEAPVPPPEVPVEAPPVPRQEATPVAQTPVPQPQEAPSVELRAAPLKKSIEDLTSKKNWNQDRPLSDVADTAYHENSMEGAMLYIDPGSVQNRMPELEVWLSNDPDIALGQRGQGVVVEFDTRPLKGHVNTKKPTWKFSYESGQAELVARYNDLQSYQGAVRSVTVKADAQMTAGQRRRFQAVMQRKGWKGTTNPDGSVTYRPATPERTPAPPRSPAPDAAAAPPATPEAPAAPAVRASQVGDRVRTQQGSEGRVVEIDENGFRVVETDDGAQFVTRDQRLQVVEPSAQTPPPPDSTPEPAPRAPERAPEPAPETPPASPPRDEFNPGARVYTNEVRRYYEPSLLHDGRPGSWRSETKQGSGRVVRTLEDGRVEVEMDGGGTKTFEPNSISAVDLEAAPAYRYFPGDEVQFRDAKGNLRSGRVKEVANPQSVAVAVASPNGKRVDLVNTRNIVETEARTLGAASPGSPAPRGPSPAPAPPAPRPGPMAPAPPSPPRTAAAGAAPKRPQRSGRLPEVKSPQQLARDLAKAVNVRIQYGRGKGMRKNNPGRFWTGQRVIEAAKSGDMSTVYHEVGHAIDIENGLSDNLSGAASREIESLADPSSNPGTISSWRPGMPQRTKLREGMAEFIRGWFEDPTGTRIKSPTAAAEFEVWLGRQGDFGRRLRRAQMDYQKRINAPAQAVIRANIVYDRPGTPLTAEQVIASTFDQFHALDRLSETVAAGRNQKVLAPSDDPYVMARLLKGSPTADFAINRRGGGIVDPVTMEVRQGTRSLVDILEPVANDAERSMDFMDYLVGRRAQELHARGLESGFDPADVDEAVQQLDAANPDFDALAKEVYQWNDDVLQYAVDGGYLSAETAEKFRALNQNYVPFHRLFEVGANEFPELGSGMGAGLQASSPSSFKKLRGSAREVINPMESMVRNASAIFAATERNRVGQTLLKLWDQDAKNLGKFMREVKAPQQGTNVSAGEVVGLRNLKRELEAMGVDLQAAGINEGDLRGLLDALPDVTVIRNRSLPQQGTNTIAVKTADGKTRFLELTPTMYQAWTGLHSDDVVGWVKALGTFAQSLRLGATTFSAAFHARNMIRDSFSAALVSRVGSKPLLNLLDGMAAWFNRPLVEEWIRSGGSQGLQANLLSPGGYKREVQKVMRGLTPAMRKNTWAPARMFQVAGDYIRSPFELLSKLSEQSEMFVRLSEYKRAKKVYSRRNPGWSASDVQRRAAFESRDLLDFSMSGSGWVRNFRRIVPFYGTKLTGNYRLYRAMREDPAGFVARGMFYIGAPTLAFFAHNMATNRENYFQIPQRERDIFWHIATGDGPEDFVRIPKPFLEGSIFGTTLERLAQFAYAKDPKAFDGYLEQLGEEVLPINVMQPTAIPGEMGGPAIKTVIELGTNYDYFRQRNIVPPWVANDDRSNPKPAWTESDEYTTATAKAVGKVMNWSPMKVDHAIRGLTGTGGSDLTRNVFDPLVSRATGETMPKEKPRKALGFIYSENTSESEDRFWKLYKETGEAVNGAAAGGRPATRQQQEWWPRMKAAGKQVRDIRKNLREATDQEQRRELLDQLRRVTSEFTPAAGRNVLDR